uniref:Dermokine n=1 Tax=Canis lupus familiaris TaxID=9615 RepID=A0A8C0M7V9_CANLF
MKSRGSLACLLLALCLGSGEAGPLLRGGESAGVGAGEALGHGVGDAIGQGVGNAISQGVEEAAGQGAGEAAGPAARDAVGRGIGEAARALGNTGGEAGRQVENVIRHGADAVHGSWQGAPGSDGAWVSSSGRGGARRWAVGVRTLAITARMAWPPTCRCPGWFPSTPRCIPPPSRWGPSPCLRPAVPALPVPDGEGHPHSGWACCSCREPTASLHLEAMASLAPRVALEATARAILEVQGPPGARDILEAQMAALETTLREAPGAKEALSLRGPTLRYSNHPGPDACPLLPFKLPPCVPHLAGHTPASSLQGTVVQPGYGSVRGSNSHSECTNPPPSGSGGSSGHSGVRGWAGGGTGCREPAPAREGGEGGGGQSSLWSLPAPQGGSGSGSGGSSGGGSSSSGGSSGGGSSSGSGSSSGGGGSSGGGSSSSGSSSGGSGGSSYGPSWDRPLENSRNFDQSGYSGSQGHNTPQGHNTGSSWGSSSSGSGGGSGSGNKPGCDSPGNDVRVSGGSGGQGFGGGQGGPGSSGDIREISKEGGHLVGGPQDNSQNSQTSAGLFNFDTFWKNFKSKLGFINWDAINKGQVPRPSTRALLYFSRLWEDFKHNTPFLNWKEIIEGADATSLQKRSGGAGQSGAGWQEVAAVTSKNPYNQQAYPTPAGGQYSAKIPSKGGVTPSSSASRVRPGLLQWVKFW